MATTTQSAVAGAIQSTLITCKMFTEALVKGITPEQASCQPEGVACNHPTWNIGHLSIYFDTVLKMINREDLVSPREGYEELFSDKSTCQHDPKGTVYPPFSEVCEYFNERLDTVCKALDDTTDETLGAANEVFFQEVHPTVGQFVNFLMGSHTFLHLGQTSTWRRAMGLGPCM
jgi:DinB family protein